MSIRGVKQVVLLEPEMLYVARLDGNVPKGITGTVASGSSAGFRRQLGVTAFTENVPESQTRSVPGDGGVIGQYKVNSTEPITIASAFAVFDQVTITELSNRTIHTEGAWEISQRARRCRDFKDLAFIVSGKAMSQEAGSVGDMGWYTIFYYRCSAEEVAQNLQIGQETGSGMSISVNEVDTTWWEEAVTDNYGQSYTWASDPIIADYPIMAHYYHGDGTSDQTFTVDLTPAAADGNSAQIWEDGVKATYTTDYTIDTSTKVVTFETAGDPADGDDILLLYEYMPSC